MSMVLISCQEINTFMPLGSKTILASEKEAKFNIHTRVWTGNHILQALLVLDLYQ